MFSPTLRCFEFQIKKSPYNEQDIDTSLLRKLLENAKADVERIEDFLTENFGNNLKHKTKLFFDGDSKLKEIGINENTFSISP